MPKLFFKIGIVVSVVSFAWIAGGSLGAANFFETSIRGNHRLVGTLLCEDPVTTFLSVMNLRGKERNRVEIRWTDEEGMQMMRTEVIERHVPLAITCETVPSGFSLTAPITVHLDSQFPTSGVLTHVVRGSPVQSAGFSALRSL